MIQDAMETMEYALMDIAKGMFEDKDVLEQMDLEAREALVYGWELINEGNLNKSFRVLDKYAGMDNEQSYIQLTLAIVYLLNGNNRKALKHLEKIIKKDPGNFKPHLLYAYACQFTGWYKKAIEAYEKVLN